MDEYDGAQSDVSLSDNDEVSTDNVTHQPYLARGPGAGSAPFTAPRPLHPLLPNWIVGNAVTGRTPIVSTGPTLLPVGITRAPLGDAAPARHVTSSPTGRGVQQEVVTNWTVKKPGKTKVPTSNDYNVWDLDQLRKECTARGKKIPRTTNDESNVRRSWLEENDLDRQQLMIAVDPEMAVPLDKRQTESSTVRLVNVCVSDEFVDGLVRSEDAASRPALDTRAFGGDAPFWISIADAYCGNGVDFNGLYTDDPRFTHLDPSRITPHDSHTLHKMWKTLLQLYTAAYKKSTQSGEHSDDFLCYCNGRLDVAYLHVCAQIKPQIASFVRGGMPKDSQMDSAKAKPGSTAKGKAKRGRPTSTPATKEEEVASLRETLTTLTAYVTKSTYVPPPTPMKTQRDVADILNCMATSYTIVEQLETSKRKATSEGRSTHRLARAIELQEEGIRKLEQEYANAMELGNAKKKQRTTTHAEAKEEEDDVVLVV